MVSRHHVIIAFVLFPAMSFAAGINFSSVDINGKTHQLSDYKGQWVVVNYWATWCPPCLDEIPELIEFHEAHRKNDAVVLGINFEEVEKDYLQAFIDEYFITYPILKADLSQTSPFGRVVGLPTTFIVSPEGKVVNTKVGGVTRQWIEAVITQKKQSMK